MNMDFDANKIKRVIFDIDYTLLIPNYYRETEFFEETVPNHGEYLTKNILKILTEYENIYRQYDKNIFINHLNKYLSYEIGYDFIEKWFKFNAQLDNQDTTATKETLEYLKKKKLELVVLSNWFTKPQKEKLKRVGLISYFDQIYGGDYYLKPYEASFLLASHPHKLEECVMIGDNIKVDVEGAINTGMNAIYYTLGEEKEYSKNKIKNIKELKKIF